MKTSIYQEAKKLLKSQAKEAKRTSTDLGYIRYYIDCQLDEAIRQMNWYAMKETISEKQAKQYSSWLASFAADLKP